jgi:hypothetical protein
MPYGENPVSLSDPDGDLPFLAIVAIGADTGVFSNGLSNVSSGQNLFCRSRQSIGAAGSFGHELLRAGAHGLTQGGISAAQGSNFWQGALSGAKGSGISSGIDALGGSAGHQILGGGLSGGIGSDISGGNFWQGFEQGIAVGAFNHALHSAASNSISGCPCKYNGKEYKTEGDLYFAILANEAMQQFGILDLVSLGGLLAGQPDIAKRFITKNSSKGTSVLSKYLRRANLGNFEKAKWAPTSKNLLAKTISKGAFAARWIPWVGAGILAYDIGMTFYNTQKIYNQIISNGN